MLSDLHSLGFPTQGRLVFVNGLFCEALSELPTNVTYSLDDSNDCIWQVGTTHQPLECVFMWTADALPNDTSRHVFRCAPDANVEMIFRIEGHQLDFAQAAASTLLYVGEHAHLRVYWIQSHHQETLYTEHMEIIPKEGASVDLYALALGGRNSRLTVKAEYHQPHVRCNFYGLYYATGRQQMHFDLYANHKAPSCSSAQHVKGCVSDAALGAYHAKVVVPKSGVHAESRQSHHGLLLSNFAKITAKPELEIDCDEVVCQHGATVGCLSPEALFYLEARGLETECAQALLKLAHLKSAFSTVESTPVFKYCMERLAERMGMVAGELV